MMMIQIAIMMQTRRWADPDNKTIVQNAGVRRDCGLPSHGYLGSKRYGAVLCYKLCKVRAFRVNEMIGWLV